MKDGMQSFGCKAISELTEDDVSYPIDKKVVRLLKESKG